MLNMHLLKRKKNLPDGCWLLDATVVAAATALLDFHTLSCCHLILSSLRNQTVCTIMVLSLQCSTCSYPTARRISLMDVGGWIPLQLLLLELYCQQCCSCLASLMVQQQRVVEVHLLDQVLVYSQVRLFTALLPQPAACPGISLMNGCGPTSGVMHHGQVIFECVSTQ